MRERDDVCVSCGEQIPEGYGMVCHNCQKKNGIMSEKDYSSTLFTMLQIERTLHNQTRRKLQKADHDRERYMRRIKFIESRHEVLCREYRAEQKELEILKASVNSLERILLIKQERMDGERNEGPCIQT